MNSSATAFDAWSGLLSAALYLIVGAAALASAPRDTRARVFLVVAAASVLPYIVPFLIWWRGARIAWHAWVVVGVAESLALGGLSLFHFMQVFPQARPWIRAHPRWLVGGYTAVPVLGAVSGAAALPLLQMFNEAANSDAGGLGAVALDPIPSLMMVAVLIPAIVVIGIILPLAALTSLYKSWQEAKRDGRTAAAVTSLWMLISQLAGGVLTILIVPVLHLVAPPGPWVTIASALLFGFGLLMPIAFAIGVWKYRLLGQA
jgi:hypothetical protein